MQTRAGARRRRRPLFALGPLRSRGGLAGRLSSAGPTSPLALELGLCDQPGNLARHSLGVDGGFKNAVTSPTVPKMANLPLITVLGPFRGDYVILAMGATHSKARLASGCFRGHGNNLPFSAYCGEVTK